MVDPVHVVALSGGKDSTAMALALREREPRAYRYVCTPTGNETPDMVAHWARLEALLGAPLEFLGGQTLEGLMDAQRCLPTTKIRWCTRMLKIEPVQRFYASLPPGSVAYVGLRADEETREGIFGSMVRQAFPLQTWGWKLADVQRYLRERGVKVPPRTDCMFCPYQAVDDWYRLWRDHRDMYLRAEGWERTIGHTFRSPTAKLGTWAAGLEELRAQFEAGKLTREERRRRQGALPLLEDDEEEQACRVCRL